MIAFAVAVLPDTSPIVNTTLFAPKLAQLNAVLLNKILVIPILSVDPLFTAAALTLAAPKASR